MRTHTLRVGDQVDLGGVRLTVLAVTADGAVLGFGSPAEGKPLEDARRLPLLTAALTHPPGRN